jgi:hypothetical protein
MKTRQKILPLSPEQSTLVFCMFLQFAKYPVHLKYYMSMALFFYMSNWSNLAKCRNIDVVFRKDPIIPNDKCHNSDCICSHNSELSKLLYVPIIPIFFDFFQKFPQFRFFFDKFPQFRFFLISSHNSES